MGVIECDVVDTNHIPLTPATCRLYLKNVANDVLEDTKVTDSRGIVFLDTNRYFCFDFYGPYVYKIVVTYGNQTVTVNDIIANINCTASVQTAVFQAVGGCPGGCPTGYICIGNQCVKTGCTSNADCPPNYHCVNGQCVFVPPTGCTNNSQCPTGYHCVNGQCVQGTGGGGNVLLGYVALSIIGIAAAVFLASPRNQTVTPRAKAKRSRRR